jgi:hypothetical protein
MGGRKRPAACSVLWPNYDDVAYFEILGRNVISILLYIDMFLGK